MRPILGRICSNVLFLFVCVLPLCITFYSLYTNPNVTKFSENGGDVSRIKIMSDNYRKR